jgi:hypothetical protein
MRILSIKHAVELFAKTIKFLMLNANKNEPVPQPVFLTLRRRS